MNVKLDDLHDEGVQSKMSYGVPIVMHDVNFYDRSQSVGGALRSFDDARALVDVDQTANSIQSRYRNSKRKQQQASLISTNDSTYDWGMRISVPAEGAAFAYSQGMLDQWLPDAHKKNQGAGAMKPEESTGNEYQRL